MNITRRPVVNCDQLNKITGLSLVIVMLLTYVIGARAESITTVRETNSNPADLTNSLKKLDTPIAVDDSGQGFNTYGSSIFSTSNVLANDSDADGDRLFVSSIDTSSTEGLVSPIAGSMDKSFGGDGKVSVDSTSYQEVNNLAIQPDGKLVMIGTGVSTIASDDFLVLRFNTDGSLDQSFGQGGKVLTDFDGMERAYDVAVQPDNKILVAGYTNTTNISIARYNPNGSLDASFDGDGKVTTQDVKIQDLGYMGISLQADGKIVVVGTYVEFDYKIIVVRFTPTGGLDSTFDDDGMMILGIDDSTSGRDVVIQPDQKILVSGFGIINAEGFVVVRINTDGSLDYSFSEDGIAFTAEGRASNAGLGRAIALQADQKIVTVGNTDDYFAMVRYNPDGSLDPTFGGDGIILNNTMNGQDVEIQPNGKIIVAGTCRTAEGGFDMCVYRYNEDGSIDPSFGIGGSVRCDFGVDRGNAVALGQKGTVDIGGTAWGLFNLAQLIGDGTFTYNPNHQFDYLSDDEQAFDTFSYTVSDGTLTDSGVVTITIKGFSKSTYLPIAFYRLNLFGKVTENGFAAQGVPLELRFFDGTGWSTIATTTTGSSGIYNFGNIPDLTPGQKYYVLYRNHAEHERLWVWATKEISNYTSGSSINIGNFDISDIDLISPPNVSSIALPYTFQWARRLEILGDSYEFDLYDPYDGVPYYYTPLLGYTDSYNLPGLPAGFTYNHRYAWEIWVYSPDGGYGISLYSYEVFFTISSADQLETGNLSQHDGFSEIEIRIRR